MCTCKIIMYHTFRTPPAVHIFKNENVYLLRNKIENVYLHQNKIENVYLLP